MRIVLTVPEDKMREACQRIVVFCKEHADYGENRKEIEHDISIANDLKAICENDLARVA